MKLFLQKKCKIFERWGLEKIEPFKKLIFGGINFWWFPGGCDTPNYVQIFVS